ncbi:MAG: hypothetical protein AAF171_06715 [Cyanobacteria bacterium P01_A01_bin.116]
MRSLRLLLISLAFPQKNRQVCDRIFQDWAAQENLQLSLSQKMMSNARRR